MTNFVQWYNHEHRHSAIGFVTPGSCYGLVALHFVLTGGGDSTLGPVLYRSTLALGAALGLAVIHPLTVRAAGNPRGFLAWARSLAYLSLAVTVVEGLAGPQLSSMKERPLDTPFNLDPYMWVILGGLGMWLLAVNIAALRSSAWARALSYVGCIAGACCVAFPFAVFGSLHRFVDFVVELPLAAGIGILIPVWFIWVAVASPRAEA